MPISIANQNELYRLTSSIIETVGKHKIEDLWIIPSIAYDKEQQVDLMFSYNEDDPPSVHDMLLVSEKIEKMFDFKINWHSVNMVIANASKVEEGKYHSKFLHAIHSCIPLSLMLPDIALEAQFENSKRLSEEASNVTIEMYLPKFTNMAIQEQNPRLSLSKDTMGYTEKQGQQFLFTY
ncbi:MAG: hypothetical protein ACR2HS_03620 [Gammaproteobacteria bacterium]